MTKGEIRKARKEARAAGVPLTGELAIPGKPSFLAKAYNLRATARPTGRGVTKAASRAEQHARYIDCGPANWDDR